MAITMILITFSFLICWGPDILQTALQYFYWDFTLPIKMFEKFYDEESAYFLGHLFSSLLFKVTILNSLFDPLIFLFRMKTVRESAVSMFKSSESSSL
jgi:hypothetical protein